MAWRGVDGEEEELEGDWSGMVESSLSVREGAVSLRTRLGRSEGFQRE